MEEKRMARIITANKFQTSILGSKILSKKLQSSLKGRKLRLIRLKYSCNSAQYIRCRRLIACDDNKLENEEITIWQV